MAKKIEGDNQKKSGSSPIADNTPKSIWTSNRDNSKAAPDAYKEEGNPSFISEYGSVVQKLKDVSSFLKGGEKVNLNTIKDFIKDVGSALSKGGSGVGGVLDKISSLGGVSTGIITKMGLDKSGNIANAINQARDVLVKTNNVITKIKNTDFSNVDNILRLTKEITGSDFMELSNVATQAKYVQGLISELVDHDIKGSIHAFKDIISRNPFKTDIAKAVTPKLVNKQDFKSIEGLVDILGRKTFNNINGDVVKSISSNWNKRNEPVEDDFKIGRELVSTMKKIKGDDWLYVDRGTKDSNKKKTIDIKSLLTDNERFIEVLKKGVIGSNKIRPLKTNDINNAISDNISGNEDTKIDDEKYLIMASIGIYQSCKQCIKRDFPRVVIEPNTVHVPIVRA